MVGATGFKICLFTWQCHTVTVVGLVAMPETLRPVRLDVSVIAIRVFLASEISASDPRQLQERLSMRSTMSSLVRMVEAGVISTGTWLEALKEIKP